MGATMTEAERGNAVERLLGLLPPVFGGCLDRFGGGKYDLSTPFVDGGHVYATNGQIAARVAVTPELAEACAAVDKGGRRPKAAALFGAEYDPTPVPVPDTSHLKVCPRCKGADRVPVTPDDWEDFDEDGLCIWCEGTHIEDPHGHPFDLGRGVWIWAPYAVVLARVGATLYLPVTPGGLTPVRFTAGGAEGLLMPLARRGSDYPPER